MTENPFSPARYADWLTQVQKDLKDPAAYETLRWQTPEGFVAEPYYTPDQLSTLPLAAIQAAQRSGPGWLNMPAYEAGADPRATNRTLRDAIANGAEALLLHVPAEVNVSLLLDGIKLTDTPVYFSVTGNVGTFLTALRQVMPCQLRGGLAGSLAGADLAAALHTTADSPAFRVIHIDGAVFHNAGATATQELAFTLAKLTDVFDQLTDAGFVPELLAASTTIRLAVGTSYFIEIAKLRAMRVLLARFASAYSLRNPAFWLHGETSAFYDSTATPYTNLLRGTTEAMAAAIGGCDLLTVRPYDAVLPESVGTRGEFSQRIARNVSTLLREEGQFEHVADPAAGSYYIETLTHQLAEAAWALFLKVEQKGGLSKATGYVRDEIDAAYASKIEAVRQGRVLVGVTKFRHDEEGTAPTQPASESREEAANLPIRRLAQPFE